MKKLAILLAVIMLATVTLVGCEELDIIVDTLENGMDNGTEQAPETVPTFEELIALNRYGEIFKLHETMYFKTVYDDTDPAKSFIEEGVLMRGEGKVDYHMKNTMTIDGVISQDLSRVDNEWYYYSTSEPLYTVLELGESFLFDYTLPEIFVGTTIGKAYVDGDQIVQHAFTITAATEDSPASRTDYTYYFNKETKLVEKVTETIYDEKHAVRATSVTVLDYDVKVSDVFDTTARDTVYGSEDRIDLEIVVGYGTEEQKSYSFVSTTDALLFVAVNSETYLIYADPEFQNRVVTLEDFVGEKTLTLYAKKVDFTGE